MYRPLHTPDTSELRHPSRWRPLAIVISLFSLCLGNPTFAVIPPPDGGYPNYNTAEGTDALFSLTTGILNTAVGEDALFNDTSGGENTAIGYAALFSNDGYFNTATGGDALFYNSTGGQNTANGYMALYNNTTGYQNSGLGMLALYKNVTGYSNTAQGYDALYSSTSGDENTAIGGNALYSNTRGGLNTAVGVDALYRNKTGDSNIGLGNRAGSNLTTGSNNIDIGNNGVRGEAATIRIGTAGTQTAAFVAGISGVTVADGVTVVVAPNGQLGTLTSFARCKEAIEPMEKASEAILSLQPVTFRYKKELDPKAIPQFGLVAEEVEKVDPDLVARDEQGKPYTVRYEAVNAMLLNEFLKEHHKVEAQEAAITELRAGLKTLAAAVREQATQIQKVSDQLAATQTAPPMLVNSR